MALTEFKSETHHYFIDEMGNRQGEYKVRYVNGQLREHRFFVDGELHGPRMRWHENGKLAEHGFMVGGDLQGEYKFWHDNGQLDEHCFWLDDELHGECKSWDREGNLVEHFVFINGEQLNINAGELTDKDKMVLTLKYGDLRWL